MSENPTVTIKGQVYNLPPLNVGQVRHFASPLLTRIKELSEASDQEEILSMIGDQTELLHLALTNEYPKLALADVETLFMQDIQEALVKVITRSQLARTNQGEAKAPAKRSR